MRTRIISAIVASAIVLPFLLKGGNYLMLLVGVLSIQAYKEVLGLSKKHDLYSSLTKIVGLILFLLIVFTNHIAQFELYILISILSLSFIPVFSKDKNRFSDILILMGYVIFLGILFNSLLVAALNLKIFIYLLSITVLGDTFAMLFGMLIGRHKLCPEISPKKTVEGSIGGFLIALTVSSIIYANLINDFSIYVLIVGSFLAVASQVGDLIFSMIKRENKIKDFSNIMPGHGGVLDRLDSILILSLVFVILERIL